MAAPAHMKQTSNSQAWDALHIAEAPEPIELLEPAAAPDAAPDMPGSVEDIAGTAGVAGTAGTAGVADAASAAGAASKSRKGRIVAIIASLLLVAYVAGVVYFSQHFMPKTFAVAPAPAQQGSAQYEDLSFKPIAQYKESLAKRCSDFSATVSKGEYALTVKGAEVDLAPNDSDLITKVEQLKGDPLLWPIQAIGMRRLDESVAVSYSEDKLKQVVEESIAAWNETAEKPGPPSVVYNEKAEKFEAVHGTFGTQLEAEPVQEIVAARLSKALSEAPAQAQAETNEPAATEGDATSEANEPAATEGEAETEDSPKVEEQPEGASKQDMESTAPASEMDDSVLTPPETAEDISHLEELAAQGNKMLDLSIPIYVNGEEGYRIQRHEILSWLVLDNNEFSLDTHRIGVWVDDILSPAINYTDDKYEWHTWRDLNTETIANAVTNLSEEPIEAQMFTMLRVPDETPGAKERGRHIDVNIYTQYARMYNEKGEIIWETFIVTGEADGTHNTPTGTFQIQAKETNRVLIGLDEDKDGEPDYRTPVTYWMPFAGGYGLHDATWRSSFGGDIYSYGGSHGCVNLPYAKAESLFNIVNVGDTVYIHP